MTLEERVAALEALLVDTNDDVEDIRVVAYFRVSTKGQTVEAQRYAVERLAESRGWTICAVYQDEGYSGKDDKRPGLREMLADAKAGLFDVIVVWKCDRLFRSLKHMVQTLEMLEGLGVGFTSVTEPFDVVTPEGKLVTQIVAAFAEFERSLHSQRTSAGLAKAKRNGVRLGRPLKHVPIAKARLLLAKGYSIRAAAKKLKCGASTLHKKLQQADEQYQARTS